MADFTSYDFEETVEKSGFALGDVDRALAAWGKNGDYAEWSGGFLLRLKDGRLAYSEGWCDTTGWGCQDGVTTKFVDAAPDDLNELIEDDYNKPVEWERDPADLNRLIAGEIAEFDRE